MTRLFNQKRKKMGEIILKAGLIGTKRKFFHLNLFGCHIYITTHLMRTRQARDKRWISDEEWHNSEKYKLKSMMYEKMGGVCSCCGQYRSFNKLHLHHVLPWHVYPEFENKEWNLKLYCHECHKRLHNNPLWEAREMREVADMYGVRLEERYVC